VSEAEPPVREGEPPVNEAAPPARSAALTLGQAILALQALAALFATSLLSGLSKAGERLPNQGAIWGVGLAVALLLLIAAGTLARAWGRALGWAAQAPMIAGVVVSVPVAVVGGVFLGLWIAALRIGDRIDRERALYREATRAAYRDATRAAYRDATRAEGAA